MIGILCEILSCYFLFRIYLLKIIILEFLFSVFLSAVHATWVTSRAWVASYLLCLLHVLGLLDVLGLDTYFKPSAQAHFSDFHKHLKTSSGINAYESHWPVW